MRGNVCFISGDVARRILASCEASSGEVLLLGREEAGGVYWILYFWFAAPFSLFERIGCRCLFLLTGEKNKQGKFVNEVSTSATNAASLVAYMKVIHLCWPS